MKTFGFVFEQNFGWVNLHFRLQILWFMFGRTRKWVGWLALLYMLYLSIGPNCFMVLSVGPWCWWAFAYCIHNSICMENCEYLKGKQKLELKKKRQKYFPIVTYVSVFISIRSKISLYLLNIFNNYIIYHFFFYCD